MMSLKATPTITAFERSPDGGKEVARDMRVRRALEEVGQPYGDRALFESRQIGPTFWPDSAQSGGKS
jgi:glutathione S-transferase